MNKNSLSKKIIIIILFLLIILIPTIGLAEETMLTDDFNDNMLNNTIWIEEVAGSQSSYQ
ncbi:MAG: hypothetical protein R6U21_07845 [Thermoplasmatota archaeon]